MKRFSYREQDYAFGQHMLTLRSALGLTQEGLAQALGVSRRSVADWEAGTKYPKAAHLKQLVALAVAHHAFEAGQEADAFRALWKAARQKELLSEGWLAEVLAQEQVTREQPDAKSPPATTLPARDGSKGAGGCREGRSDPAAHASCDDCRTLRGMRANR